MLLGDHFQIVEKDEQELLCLLYQLNLILKPGIPHQQYFSQENYKHQLPVFLLNYLRYNNE